MWQLIFGATVLVLMVVVSWLFVLAPPEFVKERHDAFMLFAAILSAFASFVTAAAVLIGVNEISKRQKDD